MFHVKIKKREIIYEKKKVKGLERLNIVFVEMENVIKKLHNTLKLSGFLVRREYCSLFVSKFYEQGISLEETSVFDGVVKNLCDFFEKQCISDQSIEAEHIERAVEVCLNSGYDQHETVFNVIDAFDFPKLSYNVDRKQYYINKKKSELLSDANSKATLYSERYITILQRTKRNFTKNLQGKNQLRLKTVDYLLTLPNVTLEHTLILGTLFQAKEGKYFLEDNTGIVELNLAHTTFHGGLFVENCFVLVNGYYEDRILHVSTMVLPPGEEYENSKASFGNINYFGGLSNKSLRDSLKLKEQMNEDKKIIFFSDVYLDHAMMFDKLQYLFDGFNGIPPVAFVFMGNFISNSQGSEMLNILKKLLKKLAELVLKYRNLVEKSHFVFIPSLEEPCMSHMAPRFALPDYITSDVKRLLPKSIFTTNPCRIQYCSREIVVFRADITTKLLQGTLHKPSQDEIGEFVKKTIISQGHLTPFSLNAMPVHWDFDYCMRLYPLPDLIVIGDKAESYHGNYKECEFCLLGPFYEKEFQFVEYSPLTNTLNDCDLETDD